MKRLPALWLCADLDELAPLDLVARVASVIATGTALVWLRSPPETPVRIVSEVAAALLSLQSPPTALLVGDRVDVALAVGAHGVHLTEHSLLPADVRRLAHALGRPDVLISQAVHDAAGIARARGFVDAMVLSPFGAVVGKGAALGPEAWGALRRQAPEVFAVALGGIVDAGVVAAATSAGADGVAVRRALSGAVDPAVSCALLRPAMP